MAGSIPRVHKSGPAGFISVEIIGTDKGVHAMLQRLDTAMSPPSIASMLAGEVGPYLRGRAIERFSQEGDDVVGRWKPLSSATEEIRANNSNWGVGPAHPINVRTGEMIEYVTEGTFEDVHPHSLGATLYYPSRKTRTSHGLDEKMKTAQQGKSRPSTPPRPVLGMNEADMSAILLLLAQHIKGRP